MLSTDLFMVPNSNQREKKGVLKAFQALTTCYFIRGALPPVKTTFTSKQPGPSKNEKKSSKLNLHLPMQLQQDNSSSISNNDVIAILKQSLQSLESFKQEVQMLKEAKDNVSPTLTSPACPTISSA